MRADAAPGFLWLPDLGSAAAEFALDQEDAHYVARVCRAQPGDSLTATDGEGTLATLEVLAVRGEVRVRVGSRHVTSRGSRAIVGCGAPEADRADWLVEKLGELGVATLQPLECERGGWERFASRRARFERLAGAALRQSRRAFRLWIEEPVRPAAWIATLPGESRRWLADPDGRPAGGVEGEGSVEVAAVGPASGFTPGERESLRNAGFEPLRLAGARLRTETAAVAWAATWAARAAGATN